ncbi:hypothetical protein OAP18_02075 [Gammaproteobacteria bacterium]|nr:hypothetical protein [Gammaproteobacteria bacterium]
MESCINPESDVMVLDAQTLKDLEVFESEVEGESLFDFCNYTRTKQGAHVLKARMHRPWSNPARIRAVQESLSFIISHRQSFDRWPSFVTTDLVEHYLKLTLPPLMSKNAVEFSFGILEIRFGDYSRYAWILRGVDATSALICALRKIVDSLELIAPCGELTPILEEMRVLLARPGLSDIEEHEAWSLGPWTVMRIDQIFRLYEKGSIDRLLKLIYEVDALLSMADVTRTHDFVMPSIEAGPLSVQAEGVLHPLVQNAVSNPVELDQGCRLLFLTGPNMAGKTTYLRACAISIYLAHLGMGVPARSFSFVPAQRLFSSITLSDNLRTGVSFFLAEAQRVKAIAQAVADGYSVIALMDEPFKGTNVKDAFDASRKILERFATKEGSLFMFSSHLIELCDQLNAIDQVDCRYFEASENAGKLSFEYVIRRGVSSQRLGMRVLQEEGIFDLLDKN